MKSNLSHELPIFSVPRLSSNKIVAHLEATLRAATLRLNETCNSFTNGAFCDDRPLYHLLMGNMFMLLLVLCVFGNCVNLIIYHSDQMRQFLAIKMLSAKVLLNTLLMVCFLPQALRICQIWSANSGAEAIYWQTWPYLMYLINVLGFCSMWLTVLITFEYYLHVAFPTHSKLWCNEANVSKCSFIILLVALSLHLIVPLNRIIDKLRCPGNRIFYQVTMRPGTLPDTFEKAYAWINLLIAIILPLAVLSFMSIFITWRLLFKYSAIEPRHTSEKHCVSRITLVTTALQLLCAGPAVPVLIIAAVDGPAMHDELNCFWHTVAHFLGLCNLSLSFYVYLLFSDKFRSLVATKLANCQWPLLISRRSPLPNRVEGEMTPLQARYWRRKNRARSCPTDTTYL